MESKENQLGMHSSQSFNPRYSKTDVTAFATPIEDKPKKGRFGRRTKICAVTCLAVTVVLVAVMFPKIPENDVDFDNFEVEDVSLDFSSFSLNLDATVPATVTNDNFVDVGLEEFNAIVDILGIDIDVLLDYPTTLDSRSATDFLVALNVDIDLIGDFGDLFSLFLDCLNGDIILADLVAEVEAVVLGFGANLDFSEVDLPFECPLGARQKMTQELILAGFAEQDALTGRVKLYEDVIKERYNK